LTAIIGVVHNDKVYMGGDTCSNVGWEQYTLKSEKVFKLPKANMLVGIAGTFRDVQIIRYHCDIELPDEDAEATLVKVFIPSLISAFKTHGSNNSGSGESSQFNSEILVGFRGRLFLIDCGYAVVECIEGFRTIGNGGSVALGAIAVAQEVAGAYPNVEDRIRMALKIAEQFTSGVRAPFIVESI
jgi:ATP-dependent protease HslVU (ClpYQ) peptidase subunit